MENSAVGTYSLKSLFKETQYLDFGFLQVQLGFVGSWIDADWWGSWSNRQLPLASHQPDLCPKFTHQHQLW